MKRPIKISVEEYNQRLLDQGYRCSICGERPGLRRRLAVDHCHESGVIRGLLCHRCNLGLGMASDNPDILRKMASYLEKNGGRNPGQPYLFPVEPFEGRSIKNISLFERIKNLLKNGNRMSANDISKELNVSVKRINEAAKRRSKYFDLYDGLISIKSATSVSTNNHKINKINNLIRPNP